MKTLSKDETRIQRTAYGPLALAVGVPVLLVGAYFALVGTALLPLPGDPQGLHAPLWVLGAMGLAFALGGAVLTAHALRGMAHRRRAATMRTRHPDQPWLADFDWDASGIADEAASRPGNALLGTIFLAVFLTPFNWWAFFSGDSEWILKAVVVLFDLIAVAALFALVYRLAHLAKYGSSRLAFAFFPFSVGDVVRVGFFPSHFPRLQATLRFVEERFEATGSGEQRQVQHRAYEHCAETRTFECQKHSGRVPMEFKLPDNPAWFTKLTADPGIHYWELVVRADVPGVDFETSFPLPVYPNPRRLRTVNSRFAMHVAARGPLARYRFEILFALLVAAVAIVPALVNPELPGQAAQWARAQWRSLELNRALEAVDDIAGSEVMDLSLDDEGSVWVLTKYELSRFQNAGGNYRKRLLLDPARYRKEIASQVVSLSAMLPMGQGVLLGDWQGGLFVYETGAWRPALKSGSPIGRVVRVLREHQGAVYIGASNGLWRWDGERDAPPEPVAGLPGGDARALIHYGPGLLVALGPEIWRLEDSRWIRHAGLPDGFGDVAVMRASGDGRLLVGGRRGLVELDATGRLLAHELQDMQVTVLFEEDGRLWAGAWNDAVAVRDTAGWQRASRGLGLPGANLHGLVVDRQGNLWLGYYDAGVWRVATQDMLKALAAALR